MKQKLFLALWDVLAPLLAAYADEWIRTWLAKRSTPAQMEPGGKGEKK